MMELTKVNVDIGLVVSLQSLDNSSGSEVCDKH
jgi:hypothetical protein